MFRALLSAIMDACCHKKSRCLCLTTSPSHGGGGGYMTPPLYGGKGYYPLLPIIVKSPSPLYDPMIPNLFITSTPTTPSRARKIWDLVEMEKHQGRLARNLG